MSDTTLIASDMVLSGILHAKNQTVIIEGSFEGEVYADNIFVHIGAQFEGVAVSKTAEIDGIFVFTYCLLINIRPTSSFHFK